MGAVECLVDVDVGKDLFTCLFFITTWYKLFAVEFELRRKYILDGARSR
jgi:hypothetical protein